VEREAMMQADCTPDLPRPFPHVRALSYSQEKAPSADLGMARLLERLRQGEAQALGEVYDEHHEAVRAFAGRLVGEAGSAEDLVHEVFVALPRTIRRFQGESSLRSFLMGIAVNHARHHVRSASRRRAAVERMGREPESRSTSPEDSARQSAFLVAVNRALDLLPLDQRVAFVLCDVEERTSGEAAEITGAPEATMRTRLFHARKKLRAALEKEGVR
jgi:RNA polymerase sigma-70 factor (ECF subfamily)